MFPLYCFIVLTITLQRHLRLLGFIHNRFKAPETVFEKFIKYQFFRFKILLFCLHLEGSSLHYNRGSVCIRKLTSILKFTNVIIQTEFIFVQPEFFRKFNNHLLGSNKWAQVCVNFKWCSYLRTNPRWKIFSNVRNCWWV